MMDTQNLRSALETYVARWREYRTAAAELREFSRLPQAVISETAQEMGLSVTDLKEVISHGTGPDNLMRRMLRAFGHDPNHIERTAPKQARDMAILCARCNAKGRCEWELSSGTAREHAREFCPNASSFDSLG
jgi:hypothetical protein